ncbi:hypothetical protein IWX49DRAFT_550514 [Phyllosticta citricarpa]|uniref:ENTH domain-containing protein n=2 Tax=Phyllosticta TaxID=121621 RepID=A0ABR1MKV6_9PEZI
MKALIEYLYRFEYNVPRENDKGALFLFHIQVCAIGESYDVKGLRDLAKDRVKTVFENATSLKELRMHLAVKAIYDLDVASDSGLRYLVVELCREKIHDLLEIGEFCEAMDEVKGLGHDLVRALLNTPPPTTQLTPFGGASTAGLFANWPVDGTYQGLSSHANGRSLAIEEPRRPSTGAAAYDGIGTNSASTSTFDGTGSLDAHESARDIVQISSKSTSDSALPMPQATQTNTFKAATNATTTLVVPKSIFGISSPYIELDHAAKECALYGAIEFKEPYMSFSREEIRLADYSTPEKSLFNLKTSCVPESSSSFLGTDISTVSKPLDNFAEGFASVWTSSTVTQGQSSQTPRVTFNNSTPVPSPRGLFTNNPNFGGFGSGPTSSNNTQN